MKHQNQVSEKYKRISSICRLLNLTIACFVVISRMVYLKLETYRALYQTMPIKMNEVHRGKCELISVS